MIILINDKYKLEAILGSGLSSGVPIGTAITDFASLDFDEIKTQMQNAIKKIYSAENNVTTEYIGNSNEYKELKEWLVSQHIFYQLITPAYFIYNNKIMQTEESQYKYNNWLDALTNKERCLKYYIEQCRLEGESKEFEKYYSLEYFKAACSCGFFKLSPASEGGLVDKLLFLADNKSCINHDAFIESVNRQHVKLGRELFETTYKCETLEEIMGTCLYIALINKCRFSICQNCGKYFIYKRNSALYCDRIPEGQKQTCKRYAANKKSFNRKDEITKLYIKILNKLQQREKRKKPNAEENKKNFSSTYYTYLSNLDNGSIAEDEILNWLYEMDADKLIRESL